MRTFFCLLLAFGIFSTATAQLGQKINTNPQAGNSLAGTWVYTVNGQPITLVLFNNGTGEFEGENISYQAVKGKLSIKSSSETITYNYVQKGNQLTLSGGDLSAPATFTRNSGEVAQPANNAPMNSGGNAKDLLGRWEAQGMQFTFMAGGKMLYNDKTMNYTVNGNTLYCNNAEAGVEVTYTYEINQNNLMLNYNGNTIMLRRASGGTGNTQRTAPAVQSGKPGFLGTWLSTDNLHLTMMEGGRMTLEGYDLTYTYTGNTITINSPAGNVEFTYTLNGDNFNVTNSGHTTYYRRVKGNTGAGGNTNTGAATGGKIDQSMVGRWGRAGASGGGYNSNGGGSQYEEYFILNANGTYEYYDESSRSGYGGNMYGSAVSQGADRGTWRVNGNTLIAVSQTRGTQQYTFQKRNNKNGDPCIVIDGTEYVTYYKKAPWPNY